MRKETWVALALTALAAAPAAAGEVPVSLRGSPASMERQNAVAKESGLAFARTRAEMWQLESEGELVPLEANGDFAFASGVSGAVARPEVRTFVERLAAQYRDGCGERMVVTSLTRPSTRQPGNAHRLSVHPAGMAVDLRISRRAACRSWLESTLLALERRGVLDVTRESRPPHYHVALFPAAYRAYLEGSTAPVPATEEEEARAAAEKAQAWVAAAAPRVAAARMAAAGAASAFAPEPDAEEASGGGALPALMVFTLAAAAYAGRRLRTRREES